MGARAIRIRSEHFVASLFAAAFVILWYFGGRHGTYAGAYAGIVLSAAFWLAGAVAPMFGITSQVQPSMYNGFAALAALYAGLSALPAPY